jgi:hypothetical protein
MQPAIFVSAIRARHLIVIIFSLGRSLRFAQNNRGFVEKLSQLLTKNGFEAEVLPPREHRSGNLCAAQAIKPVFHRGSAAVTGGRHRSLQVLCRWLHAFQQSRQVYRRPNRGGRRMRIKSVEQIHEH